MSTSSPIAHGGSGCLILLYFIDAMPRSLAPSGSLRFFGRSFLYGGAFLDIFIEAT